MEPAKIISKDDLDAYADGELPLERMALVAAYVSVHPEAAARVEAIRALNRLLREQDQPAVPPTTMIEAIRALAEALERRQTAPDPES